MPRLAIPEPVTQSTQNRSPTGARWLSLWALLCAAVVACQGDDGGSDASSGPPQCVAFETDACTPQFPATYDRLYDEVLLPVCGVQGSACHASASAAGGIDGLVIDSDRDGTYSTLLGAGDGEAFVAPNDAECSPLSTRVNTDDPTYLMPPGESGLPDGQACALAQWIDAGAPR